MKLILAALGVSGAVTIGLVHATAAYDRAIAPHLELAAVQRVLRDNQATVETLRTQIASLDGANAELRDVLAEKQAAARAAADAAMFWPFQTNPPCGPNRVLAH